MRNEYPRPSFTRENWLSLNGSWEFGFTKETPDTIEVPFVYQCQLSGVADKTPHDTVYYRRGFTVPQGWQGNRIILHFGAVDYRCTVYVNGHCACQHEGGSTPFSADITAFLQGGEEKLFLEVNDPPEDETIPRGKQFWEGEPQFIWYTPSTGIWQSVWLEPVADSAFESIRMTPDIDAGTARIDYELSPQCSLPCTCRFAVSLRGAPVVDAAVTCHQRTGKLTLDVFGNRVLHGAFHFGGLCWSPEKPTLYSLDAQLRVGDAVTDSVALYFGMRKISIHNKQLYLNNKPYYQKLVLDQGYWQQSLLTAPTDEAFAEDIAKAKEMGFNGCRKHEKVEDPRFLYWADRLGFLVWGGMASCISYSPRAVARYMREWTDTIERDYNHPSIVVWGMLNESWGTPGIMEDTTQQSYSLALYHMAKSLDATRLVITNDGWEQTGGDICALHSYRHGAKDDTAQHQRYAEGLRGCDAFEKQGIIEHPAYARGYAYSGQPTILTEFGGISFDSQADGWGYTCAANQNDLAQEYRRMVTAIYAAEELCGFCYTQLADVQQEKNGLLTADRQFKAEPKVICSINDQRPTVR